MQIKKLNYSQEFKAESVRLVIEHYSTQSEANRNLKISN